MDSRTGDIEFYNSEKEKKAAMEANPNLKEVILNKECQGCGALAADGDGREVCKGGNRAERRKVWKCRVKKIIK